MSKELKALKRTEAEYTQLKRNYKILLEEKEQNQLKLKALEIIIISGLSIEEKDQIILSNDYDDYLRRVDEVHIYGTIKTRVEFDLLKKVLL